MSLSTGGSSPIEVGEMLQSIKDGAQAKGVSMKEYLTTELNTPEEEAPLLFKAVSCLDATSITNSNAPVATKVNTYSNNGGVKQEAINAPVAANIPAPVRQVQAANTVAEMKQNAAVGGPESIPNQPVVNAPKAANIPAPVRSTMTGGRKNKKKGSRRHKKRKASRKTRRR